MRKDIHRLGDMLEAIDAIERHLDGGREAFDRDELLRVWFLRHLEIIGEAASRLSDGLRDNCRSVPWREIVGMRNILIHGYFDIDWEAVWNAASRDAPSLRKPLEQILKKESDLSSQQDDKA
jgi:uncharacterized protein with HEPN domain